MLPLENKLFRSAEARQRRNSRIAERAIAKRATHLSAHNQSRNSTINDCGSEATTVGKLVDDGVRDDLRSAVDKNVVIRRLLLKPGLKWSFGNFNSTLAGMGCKIRITLEPDHFEANLSKYGCRIASSCPDYERALTTLRPHLREKLPKHCGGREEAAATNRYAAINVGERPRVARKELFALDAPHCHKHCRVADPLRPQLAFDHCLACGGEIWNWIVARHRCYMPVIHL